MRLYVVLAFLALALSNAFAQTAPTPFVLNDAKRAALVTQISSELSAKYVYPEKGDAAGRAIFEALAAKAYDGITDGTAFAARLTSDLQGITKDKHLTVRFNAVPLPVPVLPSFGADLALKRSNAGFERVDRLRGNIGYLKLQFFASPTDFRPRADAAMQLLANTDALIVDLRENNGGDPYAIAYLCSFLFDSAAPVHLNDLHWRDQPVMEFRTTKVPVSYLGKLVIVLTSKRTFSGGEEFANNLKVLSRATIIGETTGGGANPGFGFRLDDHFAMFVPNGYAENPITKSNWEGTGVTPNIAVPGDRAFQTAGIFALTELTMAESDALRRSQLATVITEVEARGDEALFQTYAVTPGK